MYVKLALAALLVCSLYNSAYSSLLECDDTDNPGELVTSIFENNPAERRFNLRAPEDGETETPISCIIFASNENKYHVEIIDGGIGEHFVELEVYTVDDDDDFDDHDDEDDEFALFYRFTVFRSHDDDDDRHDDDEDDRHHDDDEDDRHHDDDEDDRHHDDDEDDRHHDDDEDDRHHDDDDDRRRD